MKCLILSLYITDTLSSNLILLSALTQSVLLKAHINKGDLTNMYLRKKNVLMYLLRSYCIEKHLLLLRWDMSKVRDRFGGMGRFKGGLRWKGINYRCNYM